jgi:hypothetical protein
MYRQEIKGQMRLEIPFGVELNPDSKWVRLADVMPWEEIEESYARNFKGEDGQVAKPSRLAFGALYIQTSEGFTDEQTRDNIMENPHMQYFCGMHGYRAVQPFDASLMVHFRKRISAEMINALNEQTFASEALALPDAPSSTMEEEESGYADKEHNEPKEETASEYPGACHEDTTDGAMGNRGTLIVDATCCPQDIHYPTDIGLLNQVRETSEQMNDQLYESVRELHTLRKPRNYRQKARREYLAYVKVRKHGAKQTRKAIHKQLCYIWRNVRSLDFLLSNGADLTTVDSRLYRKWLICREVLRQQQEMYDNRTHRVDSRIVSISQPWVRPIVRGKEGTPVEFGSKVALGLVGGYSFITDMSWENIPEASLLEQAVGQYRSTFGAYPEVILADRAYPTRANRTWCKERGIRLSGPRLGRKSAATSSEEAKQLYQDGCDRNAVEGAFGVVKRKFGLHRVMTKLDGTSHTSIAMGFFVANCERKIRLAFSSASDCFLIFDFSVDRLALLIA